MEWVKQGMLWQPRLFDRNKTNSWAIANLHIYSKALERFTQEGIDSHPEYRVIPAVRDELPGGWAPPF
jgi:hypothetical protein